MEYVNASLSFLLLGVMIALMLRKHPPYNVTERLGYGFSGAGVFLSAFKQLGFAQLMLPFDEWYQLLWRVGWVLLLGGMLWRVRREFIAMQGAAGRA